MTKSRIRSIGRSFKIVKRTDCVITSQHSVELGDQIAMKSDLQGQFTQSAENLQQWSSVEKSVLS